MTHEERIKRSEERIAKSREVSAQLAELIRTTNEKLERIDDENNQRIKPLEFKLGGEDMIIQGEQGLTVFCNWVKQLWQAGDDLFLEKAEFIRDKKK